MTSSRSNEKCWKSSTSLRQKTANSSNAMVCLSRIFVSSPRSGKTSILERTLEHLKGKLQVAVIEGDVQTDFDARRVATFGVPVVQIIMNGGCHLDAKLVIMRWTN